jgi:hypothetical protein
VQELSARGSAEVLWTALAGRAVKPSHWHASAGKSPAPTVLNQIVECHAAENQIEATEACAAELAHVTASEVDRESKPLGARGSRGK